MAGRQPLSPFLPSVVALVIDPKTWSDFRSCHHSRTETNDPTMKFNASPNILARLIWQRPKFQNSFAGAKKVLNYVFSSRDDFCYFVPLPHTTSQEIQREIKLESNFGNCKAKSNHGKVIYQSIFAWLRKSWNENLEEAVTFEM